MSLFVVNKDNNCQKRIMFAYYIKNFDIINFH